MTETLRSLGATVEIHDDHFAADARDQDWLLEVGRRGWIVLMKDKRVRRVELEREALISAGVRAFVLTSGNLTGPEMAEIFARHLWRMARMTASNRAPFVAGVSRGRVTIYRLKG